MAEIKRELNYLVKLHEKLYGEKESRMNDSLTRLTRALHGEAVDRMPVWQVAQTTLFPRHELFYDTEKNLMTALAKNICSMEIETDYVAHLDPFEGVTILAEAFGAETYVQQNGDPVVARPIIKKPEDVYSLKKPDPDCPTFTRILNNLKFWAEKTGGAVPVGTTDPQSPLDVIDLLWDTNDFYFSLYEHKKEVHYLLDLITETFIDFYSRQLALVPTPAHPVHLFPAVGSADGIAVSEDEVINMTPDLYAEFGTPYLSRISEAFGGLYFHSCGNFMPFFEQIKDISRLRALNGHMSPKEIAPEMIKTIIDSGHGFYPGISDKGVGWDDPKWENSELTDLYNEYYFPSAVHYGGKTGIVVTGYGSYRGYFDSLDGGEKGIIIDGRGRPVEADPFVNVPLEEKNENFRRILSRIDTLTAEKEKGIDVTDNEAYRKFAERS